MASKYAATASGGYGVFTYFGPALRVLATGRESLRYRVNACLLIEGFGTLPTAGNIPVMTIAVELASGMGLGKPPASAVKKTLGSVLP